MASQPSTLPNISHARAPITVAIMQSMSPDQTAQRLPASFPVTEWVRQLQRYEDYWRWYTGEVLEETLDREDENGKKVLRYPLQVNLIYDFVQKHTSILFGEIPDSPVPLVKPLITPKGKLDGSEFTEEEKKIAQISQNVITEVWMNSDARSTMLEAGMMSQFLGGSVFQVVYEPWRADELLIPVRIKTYPVDYFACVYSTPDWEIKEAFITYRVSNAEARLKYGIESTAINGYSIYVEHWTESKFSRYIDGQPITEIYQGEKVTYKDRENPFGVVPFVYIPHIRSGTFWGHSLVDSVRGLEIEYNARLADLGDGISDTIHRKRYMKDVSVTPQPVDIGDGTEVIDLGGTTIGKNQPEISVEDPIALNEGLVNFPGQVFTQAMRQGQISDIQYGEDDGSQRSSLTLAIKMWTATAHGRAERNFWTDGLNKLSRIILRVVSKRVPSAGLPADILKRVHVAQDWFPQIPRDREQLVNELTVRYSSGLASPEFALESFGDVRNVDDEMKKIQQQQEFQASLQMKMKAAEPTQGSGTGAEIDVVTPVAETGVQDDQ